MALVVVGLVSFARDGRAFCRKTTCPTCPVDDDGCPTGGHPLIWPGECLSYALSRAGSRRVGLADASAISAEAFRTWQSVTCPGTGQSPSVVVTEAFGLTGCNEHEFNADGQNANVILFRDNVWPYDDAEDSVGLTTTTFSDRTGEILDADIEINATVEPSTSDVVPAASYDLLSILTHEVGHFLGLAHSRQAGATMNAVYVPGSDDFRTLSDDDVAGICSIYAPHRGARRCDFTPVGGFAAECALGVAKGGCTVSHGPRRGSESLGTFAAFCILCCQRRRRNTSVR